MKCSPLVILTALVLVPVAANSRAAGTGFIHVEKIDGVWWFINADGEKFVSVGVNHVEPHLWLAPYNRDATLKKYGSDFVSADGRFNPAGMAAGKWIDRQLEVCRELNINTLGFHTHPSIDRGSFRNRIYYVAALETAPLAGWRTRKGEGPRPDIFSSDFRAFVDDRVSRVCREHSASRNLLGYVYTDIPSWVLSTAEQKDANHTVLIYPWINALLTLGEASPGKQKWIGHLKARYSSAAAAATAWGLPASPAYGTSWDRMLRLGDWTKPADRARASADLASFMPAIADEWYRLHHEIVRKHDPHHLLLGDKNLLNMYHDWLIPALAKYVDVIVYQGYERWSDERKVLDSLHARTGKPILNGDGCFGLVLPNQEKWGVKGFRSGAKTIGDVAMFYAEKLREMMATPYVIGWHHCGYLQQWDQAERGDSPLNENGFLDPFENQIGELALVVKDANGQARHRHESAAR